jgi:hypothetical protein
MWHAWRKGEVFTGLWWEGLKVRDHCEYLEVGERITLRWTLGRQGSMGQTEFDWLRKESSGRLL